MFLFTNRAKTQLARNVGVNDTTLTLMSGGGALFPSPSGSDELFPLTLASANNPDNYEITYCIARNGDVLTVQRGQEGTTARSFMSGDVASLNATATTYRRLAQAGHLGTFSPEVAATQGGYKRGAIVNDDSVATTYWINLQDGNTTRPGPDNPTWQEFDSAALVHKNDIAFFVSGQGYGDDNLNVTRLWRGAKGTVCVRDQNGTVTFLQENGDYATHTELHSEAQRAQAAEAGLVPLDGSRWMSGQLVVASGKLTDNTQAGGFSARFKEGSISARFTVGLDAQNYPYASVSFFDQNGGFHQWQFGANNRIMTPNGGVVLEVLPSEDKHLWAHNYGGDDRRLAWMDEVVAETQRAQAAEAGLVALDGTRWMSGQLVVASGDLTDNTQAGGFSARFKDGSISARFTVGLDAQNYPYASVSFFDQNGGFHQWQFGANNRITTPNGGVVLETLPSEDGYLWAHNYGGPDKQLAWRDDVAAETQRAQAAEAQLVSGQGYGGDNLNITRFWRGSKGAVCVRDQNNSVSFLPTVPNATNNVGIQAFRVSGNQGEPWISFPHQFSAPPVVTCMVTREDKNGTAYNASRFVNMNINNDDPQNPQITSSGFWAQIVTTANALSYDTTRPWSMDVIAIGPMG